MASEALDSFYIEFLASYDQLMGAAPEITSMFADIASGADESSASISDSFDMAGRAASSFAEMSQMAAENAAASMGEVAPATGEIDAAFGDMEVNVTAYITEINTRVTEMASNTEEASSRMNEANSSSGGGFMDLFNKVGFGIFNLQNYAMMAKQVGDALLGPAVSAETVTTALTTLDGSVAAANQEMSQLNEFASKTPFKTLDIDQAAEQLQGFGFNAKNVIPTITAIGDALGSVGRDTPAELNSVVDIFGKMHTEGKITQMQMNELAVHGINGWQALADATGKTIPQLKEMVKKGLLPADDAIADLTKGIEKNPLYAGGMSKAAGTFTGLLSTLQSNWDQVVAAFGTPIIKALEGSLNSLGQTLSSPAFQAFAGSVGQGIVNVFTTMGTVVHGLNLSSLITSFGSFSSLFKGINMGNLMTTFSTLANVVGGSLTHAFQVFGPILAQVAKWFINDVLPALNKALPPIGNLINSVMDFVGAALQPLLHALEPLIPPIITIAGDLASLLGPAFKALTPVLQFIGPIIQILLAPLQALLDLLSGNWKGALNAIGLGFLTVGDKAEQMRIKTEMAHSQMALISDQKTAEGAAKAIENMEHERQGILQKLKETHDPAEKAELIHQLNMLNIQEEQQKARLQKAEEDKKAQLAKQKELHDEMLEAQKSGLQRMLDGLGHWFTSTLPNAIGGFFSRFGQSWHDQWMGIVNSVGNIFSNIKNFFRNALNDGIDIINSWIKDIDRLGFDAGPIHFHPSIPTIPHLATGGDLAPGQVGVAGEQGEELIFGGTSGAHVLNHAQSLAALSGSQRIENHVHVYLDSVELTHQVGSTILALAGGHGPIRSVV